MSHANPHYADDSLFRSATASPDFYTLSLLDALPISGGRRHPLARRDRRDGAGQPGEAPARPRDRHLRSEEHTSELQSLTNLVCRLLLEKKKLTQCRT